MERPATDEVIHPIICSLNVREKNGFIQFQNRKHYAAPLQVDRVESSLMFSSFIAHIKVHWAGPRHHRETNLLGPKCNWSPLFRLVRPPTRPADESSAGGRAREEEVMPTFQRVLSQRTCNLLGAGAPLLRIHQWLALPRWSGCAATAVLTLLRIFHITVYFLEDVGILFLVACDDTLPRWIWSQFHEHFGSLTHYPVTLLFVHGILLVPTRPAWDDSYHSMPTPQVVVAEIKGETNEVCAVVVLFFVMTCIAHLGISSSMYTCKRMPRAHNLVTARFPPCGVRHGCSVFPSFQTESFEPPEEHHHDNDHFTFIRPSADKPVWNSLARGIRFQKPFTAVSQWVSYIAICTAKG
jgi:hypothetical protein